MNAGFQEFKEFMFGEISNFSFLFDFEFLKCCSPKSKADSEIQRILKTQVEKIHTFEFPPSSKGLEQQFLTEIWKSQQTKRPSEYFRIKFILTLKNTSIH